LSGLGSAKFHNRFNVSLCGVWLKCVFCGSAAFFVLFKPDGCQYWFFGLVLCVLFCIKRVVWYMKIIFWWYCSDWCLLWSNRICLIPPDGLRFGTKPYKG